MHCKTHRYEVINKIETPGDSLEEKFELECLDCGQNAIETRTFFGGIVTKAIITPSHKEEVKALNLSRVRQALFKRCSQCGYHTPYDKCPRCMHNTKDSYCPALNSHNWQFWICYPGSIFETDLPGLGSLFG